MFRHDVTGSLSFHHTAPVIASFLGKYMQEDAKGGCE